MIKSLPVSRRTVLRGLGAAVTVPFLDSLASRASAAEVAAPPVRAAFIYVPNGAWMPYWMPSTEGAGFEMTPCLAPMAEHRSDLLVFGGLTCDKAKPNGDGAGDHARAGGAFLTGAQPRKTSGANIEAGVSADQVAAKKIGALTRIPSLEIAIERFRGSGNCDSGYSCVYEHTLSWSGPSSPLPTEVNPEQVFDRLFADPNDDPEHQKRNRLRGSVLDSVLEEATALNRRLGGTDRKKLDQYLTSVRDVENRIARTEKLPPVELPDGTIKPEGRPEDLHEHLQIMCDLMALAFQTDVTRIISFMVGREGSDQKYPMVGVNEGHHTISHHQNRQENIEKIRAINVYHMQQLAYLTGRLKSIPEGEGTLLDHCMIAYGSAIADPNKHAHEDLPMIMVGRGGGAIKPGRFLKYPSQTPLNNLWLAMLQRLGAPTTELGDSTGPLQGLDG